MIQRNGAGGNGADSFQACGLAQLHYGAFAELFLNLSECQFQCFFSVARAHHVSLLVSVCGKGSTF